MSTTLDSEERQADEHHDELPRPTAALPLLVGDRLVYRTEDLFQTRREIWFEHGTEQYRLRITAAGKLILTK